MPECHLRLIDDSSGQAIFEMEGKWFRVSFDNECVPQELSDKLAALRCTLTGLYEAKTKTYSDYRALISHLATRWQRLLDVSDVPIDEVIQHFPANLRKAWQTSREIEKSKALFTEQWQKFAGTHLPPKPKRKRWPSSRFPYPKPAFFEINDSLWQWAWFAAKRYFVRWFPFLDPEDLASTVVTRLLDESSKGKLLPLDDFPSYLYMRCKWVAIDTIRYERWRPRLPPQAIESLSTFAQEPVDVVASNEQTVILRDAISKLPERSQQVLRMRFYDGITHEKISQSMGLTPQSSRAILYRALKMLAQILQSE